MQYPFLKTKNAWYQSNTTHKNAAWIFNATTHLILITIIKYDKTKPAFLTNANFIIVMKLKRYVVIAVLRLFYCIILIPNCKYAIYNFSPSLFLLCFDCVRYLFNIFRIDFFCISIVQEYVRTHGSSNTHSSVCKVFCYK